MTRPIPTSPCGQAAGFFLAVRALGQTFALPIGAAVSAFPLDSVTRIPRAPPHILGLVNLRGQIVAAVSLGRRLDPAAAPTAPGAMAVLIELGLETYALAVEEIGDVLEAKGDRFLPTPDNADPRRGTFTLGLLQRDCVDDPIVAILDVRALFDRRRSDNQALEPKETRRLK